MLTDRPGTLTNDFFVNLLDLNTDWSPSGDEFEGRDAGSGDLRWTGSRVDLVFGSNSELRALAEVYASDDAAREVRARLRGRVAEGDGAGPLRPALSGRPVRARQTHARRGPHRNRLPPTGPGHVQNRPRGSVGGRIPPPEPARRAARGPNRASRRVSSARSWTRRPRNGGLASGSTTLLTSPSPNSAVPGARDRRRRRRRRRCHRSPCRPRSRCVVPFFPPPSSPQVPAPVGSPAAGRASAPRACPPCLRRDVAGHDQRAVACGLKMSPRAVRVPSLRLRAVPSPVAPVLSVRPGRSLDALLADAPPPGRTERVVDDRSSSCVHRCVPRAVDAQVPRPQASPRWRRSSSSTASSGLRGRQRQPPRCPRAGRVQPPGRRPEHPLLRLQIARWSHRQPCAAVSKTPSPASPDPLRRRVRAPASAAPVARS